MASDPPPVSELPELPRRRLGRLNVEVPALGFGGAALNNLYGRATDDEQAAATVRRALQLGVRYFDTSPLYGESERRMGLGLAGFPREQLFLASKTGTHARPHDYSADGTRRCVEQSLRRLGTDYLDLCLIHDPDDFDPAFAPGGALEALERLKAEGVIRAIGLGVRSHAFHRRAIRDGRFDAILTYLDYTLISQTAADLIREAQAAGVAVILGSVLAMGFLSGRPIAEVAAERGFSWANEQVADAQALWDWAAARGESLPHLALRFCLEEPAVSVALAAPRSPEEAEVNVRAAARPVAPEVWRALAAAGFAAGRIRCGEAA
jgi:aryl-alcohol dehydrogenase-like predicted oxidoreductase